MGPMKTLLPTAFLIMSMTILLANCAGEGTTPVFYERLDSPSATVDKTVAASFINGHRANMGLQPVMGDPRLDALAVEQAEALAETEGRRLSSQALARLQAELSAAGYDPDASGLITTAGYLTFAEAFSGWRESDIHNAYLLGERATALGIATHYRRGSKYRVYWAAVLAVPSG